MKEFEFIKLVEKEHNKDNLIGDDAALVYDNLLISKDILVENIHFLKTTPLKYVIHKLFTSNISDIASMGGKSEYVFLGIAVDNHEILESMAQYIKNECEKYNVVLAGGDTSSSKSGLFLSLTVLGKKGMYEIKRSGAKAGDIIFISRPVGKCRISLEKELNIYNFNIDKYYHYSVNAEDKLGYLLSYFDFISSMTDISDGLSTDLYNILESSQKKGVLNYESLPLYELNDYKIDALEYFLSSGEEYALLFTVDSAYADYVKEYVKNNLNQDIFAIGKVEEGSGLFLEKNGHMQSILKSGYQHFK